MSLSGRPCALLKLGDNIAKRRKERMDIGDN